MNATSNSDNTTSSRVSKILRTTFSHLTFFAAGCFITSFITAQSPSSPPLVFDFLPGKQDYQITFPFTIEKQKLYTFNLSYPFDPKDPKARKSTKELLKRHQENSQNSLSDDRLKVNIAITRRAPNGDKEILNETKIPVIVSWSDNDFEQSIHAEGLPPGEYVAKIKVAHAPSSFSQIQAQLILGVDPKSN